MGCLRRLLIVMIFGLQLLTFGLTLLVIGSAGVLGEAALISANDALVVFIMNAASLAGTLVLVAIVWFGGRLRRRHERQFALHR